MYELDTLGNFLVLFFLASCIVFLWWSVRATEYLYQYPNAIVPRWIHQLVKGRVHRDGHKSKRTRAAIVILMAWICVVSFALRVSLLDGLLKAFALVVYWLIGTRYVESSMETGE